MDNDASKDASASDANTMTPNSSDTSLSSLCDFESDDETTCGNDRPSFAPCGVQRAYTIHSLHIPRRPFLLIPRSVSDITLYATSDA